MGLNPTWRIHVVLAGAEALRPTDPAGRPGISFPEGIGTSRWLSGGASAATGWPLRSENLLNDIEPRHLVLNLSRTDLPDIALIDELHPQFPEGFQRVARIAEEVRARLTSMGLHSQLGGLVTFPSTKLPAAALRKISLVSRHLGFDPLVAGLDPSVFSDELPRNAIDSEALALRVTEFLEHAGSLQPKAARIERAKAGSSGSRAPIE